MAPPGVRDALPPFRPAQTPGYVVGQTLSGWARAPQSVIQTAHAKAELAFDGSGVASVLFSRFSCSI
jgi:hypothetical protein